MSRLVSQVTPTLGRRARVLENAPLLRAVAERKPGETGDQSATCHPLSFPPTDGTWPVLLVAALLVLLLAPFAL